jgi:hypothetical protein
MAGKADFTAQEWESLQQGVTGAGLLVSLSDRSFLTPSKRQAHSASTSPRPSRATQANWSVNSAALRSAKAALASKAPDELESYRQFVVEVAQSVANAAGGGETAEGGAIEKINSALR